MNFSRYYRGAFDPNILTLMNVNPHATNIVKGAVVLLAVLVDKKVKDLSAKAE